MAHTGDVFEGKTLDAAVKRGLETLGLSRAEVMITILEEGSGGFLGLGARPYRVRVMRRPGGPPPVDQDRDERRRRGPGRERRERERGRDGRGREERRGERREARGEARGEVRREARGEARREEHRGDGRRRDERRGAPAADAHGGPREERRGERREGRGEGRGEVRREERHEERREEHREERRERDVERGRPREERRERREEEVPAPEPRREPVESGQGGEEGGEGRRRRRRGRRGGRRRHGTPAENGAAAVAAAPPLEAIVPEREVEDRPEVGVEHHVEHHVEAQVEARVEAQVEAPAEASVEVAEPVRAPRPEPAAAPVLAGDELAAQSVRMTRELLAAMGFDAKVNATVDGDHVDVTAEVAQDEELLTGRKGEVRQALQHLLNRRLNRGETSRYHLQLEINDFWRRREEELRSLARSLAEEALASGGEAVSEYLNAQERRIVHVTLREDTRVKTYALGTGMIKRVAIAPADFEGGPRDEAD